MNNLEKLKEINPKLYEQIKLKYVTNAQSVKSRLDSLSLEECEEKLANVTLLEELNTLLDIHFIRTTSHSYVEALFSDMEYKMNLQSAAIKKAREELESNLINAKKEFETK